MIKLNRRPPISKRCTELRTSDLEHSLWAITSFLIVRISAWVTRCDPVVRDRGEFVL
jgi:hypothetical protein